MVPNWPDIRAWLLPFPRRTSGLYFCKGESQMSDFYEEKDGKVIITTSTDWQVECLPMADQLIRVGSAVEGPPEPVVPTYTAIGFGDEPEQLLMDQAVADDPATTEEDKLKWADYLLAKIEYDREMDAIEAELGLMRMRFMALKSTRIIDMPDLDEWAAEQLEEWGILVSSEPKTRKYEFFTAEVVKTLEDGAKLSAGILKASGLSTEVLDQVEVIFRNQMGWQEGQNTQADPKDSQEAQ